MTDVTTPANPEEPSVSNPDVPEWLQREIDRVAAEMTRDFLHPALKAAGVEDPQRYQLAYEVRPIPVGTPPVVHLGSRMSQPYCVGHCADARPQRGRPARRVPRDDPEGLTMSPSQELKAAVEKIRATAGAAQSGPWVLRAESGLICDIGYIEMPLRPGSDATCGMTTYMPLGTQDWATAAHIALMDPVVALLVADVLDQLADDSERNARAWVGLVTTDANGLLTAPGWEAQALALARAINGGQP